MLILRDTFERIEDELRWKLVHASDKVDVGEWHAQPTKGNKLLATRELTDVHLRIFIPETVEHLQESVRPNLPWAEEHFLERVGGEPLNPPPSHVNWPWAHANAKHQDTAEQFSHTYPERFWPKMANVGGKCADSERIVAVPIVGIRYELGDLVDLVELLKKNPLTRQAYLPVWFPEDLTAARMGHRVPCSLGYHFMIRDSGLSCRYYIRSVDFVRHFQDDVYLAGRLMQWVASQLHIENLYLDALYMSIGSLHLMEGDLKAQERIISGHSN